jgi:G2/mitotic-specific cyclin-B, other
MVSEIAPEIYNTMRKQELFFKVEPDYLSKVQLPTEVKDTSRAFLVEWIIDVHRKFRLLPETLYVTVFLIDRFLSFKQIKKSQLHILGVTSLLIATKYEEIYPPELKDLLRVSENKFTRVEVLAMEKDMLHVLQFNITSPSAYRFLERFRRLSTTTANDDQVFFFAQYLQEIALLDASLLKYRPSEIAAASLILSAKNIKRINPWNKEMEKAT